MRLGFGKYLLLLLVLCVSTGAMAQSATQKEAEEKREWAELIKRFSERRSYNLITSGAWALTHAGESKTEVEEILKLLTHLDSSTQRVASPGNSVVGAKGFKDKIAAFLVSKDDVVAGFAATMLGISGDLRYAPAVAKLLDKKEPTDNSEKFHPPVSSRGRAAQALSLMGAREYIPKFVSMLKSPNDYDRAGATTALGQLHAKEHAREVASLLGDEESALKDDDSPIYALMEMGVAAQYSADIAKVLRSDFGGERIETAAYALAKLGLKEYAKDIARLLSKEYRKGDAAKALAIMGATEYADEIALMLNDKSGLNRSDALLALGVMRATKYLPQIANHLKDREGYVQNHAAYALILLEANQYASEIIGLVDKGYRQGAYLNAEDFHPLVADEVNKIRSRFSDSYLKMTAQR